MKCNHSLLFTTALILTGCSVGPDYTKPSTTAPKHYRTTQASDEAQKIDQNWWKQFNDPVLVGYVEKALNSNYDIAVSEAQLNAYLAQFDQSESYLYPHINGSTSYDRKSTENAIPNRNLRDGVTSTYAASLSMTSYEIDLYGKVKRSTEAARAMLLSSEYNRRSVALSIASSVCNSYVRLAALHEQIALAHDTLKASIEIEKNTLLKYQLGSITETDWLNALSQVEASKAALSQLEAALSSEEAAFSTLLGQPTHSVTISSIDQINVPSVPMGLPSQLLTRRPDVAMAEQNLITANAKIGITKAAYFPSISLTSMLGVQSATFSDLFSNPTKLWQVTPVATIPIFTAGLIDAQVRQAQADYNQSAALYQKSVLNAFNDTDNAISQNTKASEQLTFNQKRADAMKKAFEQAQLRYRIGTYSYTELLIVQQNWNTAQQQAILSKQNLLTTTIGLYKALGGGWEK